MSTVLAVGIFGFHEFMVQVHGVVHQPIAWLILFLPIMAVTRHGVEILTAYKHHIPSMLVYSGLLPLATLAFMMLFLRNLGHDVTHAGRLGPYAERGYWALLVMSAAKIVSTWLATAPFHLMYLGRTRLVVGTLGVASLAAIMGAIPLARQWNELGAAVAYSVPLTLAFIGMHLMVRRKQV